MQLVSPTSSPRNVQFTSCMNCCADDVQLIRFRMFETTAKCLALFRILFRTTYAENLGGCLGIRLTRSTDTGNIDNCIVAEAIIGTHPQVKTCVCCEPLHLVPTKLVPNGLVRSPSVQQFEHLQRIQNQHLVLLIYNNLEQPTTSKELTSSESLICGVRSETPDLLSCF